MLSMLKSTGAKAAGLCVLCLGMFAVGVETGELRAALHQTRELQALMLLQQQRAGVPTPAPIVRRNCPAAEALQRAQAEAATAKAQVEAIRQSQEMEQTGGELRPIPSE